MKKLLAIVSVFFVLVIAGIALLPMLLPVDQMRTVLEDSVTNATGREFKINGAVSAKLLPSPAVSVSDVTFANAEWGKAPHMAQLEKLDIRIALLPALISQEIKVEKFVAHRLSLNLETGENGKSNWTFETKGTPKPDTTKTDSQTGAEPAQSTGKDFSITLGDVGIRSGRLSMTDLATGESHVLEDLDIALNVTALDQPAALEGSAVYKGEKLDFTVGVDTPKSLMDNEGFGLSMDLTAGKLAELTFKGEALRKPDSIATGKISASVPKIGALSAWATGSESPEGIPFTTATFEGSVALSSQRFALDHATLALDDLSAKGKLSAQLGGQRPMIRADLSTGLIDLDRFIAKASGTVEDDAKAPRRTKTGWSKDPIAMPVLPPVDAEITAQHEGLTYRGMEMGPATLSMTIKDGWLKANMPDTTLLGGTVALNTSYGWENVNTPKIGIKARMAGVDVKPVLTEFAEIDWVEGTGNANIDLTMEGTNMEDLMRTLNGTGDILFTDGVLHRFNLGAILEQLEKGALNTSAGNKQHTVFDKLSGSFLIKSGALHNDDFALTGPKVLANGKGRVLIVTQKYDYRVVAALLVDKQVTKTAADGTETVETVRVPGFEIPILITGRFDDPKILPDFEAIVRKAITNPDQMKKQIKNLGGEAERIKDQLKDGDAGALLNTLMGGQKKSDGTAQGGETTKDGAAQPEEETQQKPKPEDLIKGLFGN